MGIKEEIKFRALNANKEFIYGMPYTDEVGRTSYWTEYNNRLCWREGTAHHNMPYLNGTLQQFTCFEDASGVDIYAGDIVKTFEHKTDAVGYAEVHFKLGRFCLLIRTDSKIDPFDTGVPIYPFCVDNSIQIISNIFNEESQ